MASKAHHAFVQKITYFNDDLELIDALRTAVLNGDLTDRESEHVVRYVEPARHPNICRRRNADGSRELAINHLRASLYASYIKDLYEEVTEYLRTILEQASRNGFNAGQIVGEHNFKLSASAVLGLGSWEGVCRAVSESLFQCLEAERSTLDLIRNMRKKLGLDVEDALVEAALPYLQLRHYLVHTDGRLPLEFRRKYKQIPVKGREGSVMLRYSLVTAARDNIVALIESFDVSLLKKGLLADNDIR